MPPPSALAILGAGSSAPTTALEEHDQQNAKRRRRSIDRTIITKAERACKLHLTESELELAKTRVNDKGLTIIDYTAIEIDNLPPNKHLPASFWPPTLRMFQFGRGVEAYLANDFHPDLPHNEDVKKGLDQAHHVNPAERKSNLFVGALAVNPVLNRKDLQEINVRSVEGYNGLSRLLSDQMFGALLKYFGRSRGYPKMTCKTDGDHSSRWDVSNFPGLIASGFYSIAPRIPPGLCSLVAWLFGFFAWLVVGLFGWGRPVGASRESRQLVS